VDNNIFVKSIGMNYKNILGATGVAIITPFTKNFEVDYIALEKLINYNINNQVNYIVTLGTTGETPTLTAAEKIDIINFTLEIVNNRVPVVVGIGGNCTSEVVQNLQSYPIEKCEAVLSASPYYNKPSQQGIFQHYKTIAQESPKPIILYNVPGRTGSNITAETTLQLAQQQIIIGIKEASGMMVQCMHILKNRPANFLVVSGDDHLTLPLIACGMDGVISVAANCFPKDFSKMVRLCLNQQFDEAQLLQYKYLEAFDLLFAENNPAGAKAFLFEMGMIENVLRLPVVPLSEPFHQKVKNFMAQL
jgi:4-hydroxy-tetrahydrodipicolinate synthase